MKIQLVKDGKLIDPIDEDGEPFDLAWSPERRRYFAEVVHEVSDKARVADADLWYLIAELAEAGDGKEIAPPATLRRKPAPGDILNPQKKPDPRGRRKLQPARRPPYPMVRRGSQPPGFTPETAGDYAELIFELADRAV